MREQTWGKIQRAVAPPKAAIDIAPVGKAVQGRFLHPANMSQHPLPLRLRLTNTKRSVPVPGLSGRTMLSMRIV